MLIQDKEIAVNANRWPVVIIRVLPLLAVKLSCSIEAILLTLSISYALFHLGIYSILRFHFCDVRRSWLLLALLILPISHSFYWNNSELISGLSLVVLWISSVEHRRYWHSVLLIFIICWVHPLLAIMIGFIGGYYFLFEPSKRYFVFKNGLIYAATMLVKLFVFPNWYDTEKNRILVEQIKKYSFSDHNLGFLFQEAFWPIILSLTMCLLVLIYIKNFKLLIYFIVTTFLYALLQDIMIRNYSFIFYHEVSFLILFLWSAFLIQKHVKPYKCQIFVAIGYVIFLGAFIRISLQSRYYTERIEWYKQLINNNDRRVIQYDDKTFPLVVMEWGSSFETTLISSMTGQSKTVLFAKNPKDFITSDSVFVNHFGRINLSHLNTDYFDFEYKTYR